MVKVADKIEFAKSGVRPSWMAYGNDGWRCIDFQACAQNENNMGWLQIKGTEGYETPKGRWSEKSVYVTLDSDEARALRDYLNGIDWG